MVADLWLFEMKKRLICSTMPERTPRPSVMHLAQQIDEMVEEGHSLERIIIAIEVTEGVSIARMPSPQQMGECKGGGGMA